MSEKECRDFSQYDSMTTEELEQILRADVESGDESDTELILYVMEVLAERKKNSCTQEITAQQAWESFQTNYLPASENVIPFEETTKTPTRPWFRRLIASAAVIAVLILLPMATNAFRWEDVWKAVATWANGTFSFSAGDQIDSCEPAKEDCLKYASLQQALAETGQNYNIVPTWIPEGYELTNITIGESPKQKLYNAFYSKGDTPLSIFVHAHLVSDPQRIEIGESPIEVYNSDGVEYYIFANINQFQIIWHIDSYECCISCELTIDEVKMMIDSIGKG